MACDCYCSVAHPHDAVGWSAVCDCDIFLSYSLFCRLLAFTKFTLKISIITEECQYRPDVLSEISIVL